MATIRNYDNRRHARRVKVVTHAERVELSSDLAHALAFLDANKVAEARRAAESLVSKLRIIGVL